jgi:hypothetical protein
MANKSELEGGENTKFGKRQMLPVSLVFREPKKKMPTDKEFVNQIGYLRNTNFGAYRKYCSA